jgi:periplasmic protein TonB
MGNRATIERQEMLERNPAMQAARPESGVASKQPRRLVFALVLLLVALSIVLVKDRDFWFGSEEANDSDAAAPASVAKTDSKVAPAKTSQVAPAQPANAKNHVVAKSSTEVSRKLVTGKDLQKDVAPTDAPIVATNRAVLPPLDIEVIAGDSHRTVHAGSNVTGVEIRNDSNRNSAATAANLPTNAAEREPVSPASVPELRQTVDATYPLLGEHTRVQGSVVLQAVIGADGAIEGLRVLSVPAILATAAQQAVRQWRFKPYLQNGQAVETKARITVNFSIRISDNAAKAS